jgi:hypothetical protein
MQSGPGGSDGMPPGAASPQESTIAQATTAAEKTLIQRWTSLPPFDRLLIGPLLHKAQRADNVERPTGPQSGSQRVPLTARAPTTQLSMALLTRETRDTLLRYRNLAPTHPSATPDRHTYIKPRLSQRPDQRKLRFRSRYLSLDTAVTESNSGDRSAVVRPAARQWRGTPLEVDRWE